MAKSKSKTKGNSKKASSTNIVESETFTLDLECELSDAEVGERARATAALQEDLDDLQHEFSDVKTKYKQQIGGLQSRIREGLRAVLSGSETREVDCREEFNYADGTVITVRLDTSEIVNDREMTEDERQAPLGLGKPPADQEAADRAPAGA